MCAGQAVTCRLGCSGDGGLAALGVAPPGTRISAEEMEGCWSCAAWRGCVCAAIEYREALGEDTLVHTGLCFPACLPFRDHWDREGNGNTFRKRGAKFVGRSMHLPCTVAEESVRSDSRVRVGREGIPVGVHLRGRPPLRQGLLHDTLLPLPLIAGPRTHGCALQQLWVNKGHSL